MHKALYSGDDVENCMCQEKKEEEDFPALIQRLEDFIKKSEGILIIATRNNTGKAKINRTKITIKQKS